MNLKSFFQLILMKNKYILKTSFIKWCVYLHFLFTINFLIFKMKNFGKNYHKWHNGSLGEALSDSGASEMWWFPGAGLSPSGWKLAARWRLPYIAPCLERSWRLPAKAPRQQSLEQFKLNPNKSERIVYLRGSAYVSRYQCISKKDRVPNLELEIEIELVLVP